MMGNRRRRVGLLLKEDEPDKKKSKMSGHFVEVAYTGNAVDVYIPSPLTDRHQPQLRNYQLIGDYVAVAVANHKFLRFEVKFPRPVFYRLFCRSDWSVSNLLSALKSRIEYPLAKTVILSTGYNDYCRNSMSAHMLADYIEEIILHLRQKGCEDLIITNVPPCAAAGDRLDHWKYLQIINEEILRLCRKYDFVGHCNIFRLFASPLNYFGASGDYVSPAGVNYKADFCMYNEKGDSDEVDLVTFTDLASSVLRKHLAKTVEHRLEYLRYGKVDKVICILEEVSDAASASPSDSGREAQEFDNIILAVRESEKPFATKPGSVVIDLDSSGDNDTDAGPKVKRERAADTEIKSEYATNGVKLPNSEHAAADAKIKREKLEKKVKIKFEDAGDVKVEIEDADKVKWKQKNADCAKIKQKYARNAKMKPFVAEEENVKIVHAQVHSEKVNYHEDSGDVKIKLENADKVKIKPTYEEKVTFEGSNNVKLKQEEADKVEIDSEAEGDVKMKREQVYEEKVKPEGSNNVKLKQEDDADKFKLKPVAQEALKVKHEQARAENVKNEGAGEVKQKHEVEDLVLIEQEDADVVKVKRKGANAVDMKHENAKRIKVEQESVDKIKVKRACVVNDVAVRPENEYEAKIECKNADNLKMKRENAGVNMNVKYEDADAAKIKRGSARGSKLKYEDADIAKIKCEGGDNLKMKLAHADSAKVKHEFSCPCELCLENDITLYKMFLTQPKNDYKF